MTPQEEQALLNFMNHAEKNIRLLTTIADKLTNTVNAQQIKIKELTDLVNHLLRNRK